MLGSVLGLKLMNYSLSVASIAGIIATVGIAVEMLVIMIIYIKNSLISSNLATVYDKIFSGAVKRIRPKVMTAITIFASLCPIIVSNEIGSEIIKALVLPMI
jgi:Cu(I)/Ag(I) efflux system membrane protein CusA/SilA